MQSYSKVENLDEDTQRQLVLQAAKQVYPSVFKSFQRKQPTLRKVDADYTTVLWLLLIVGFFTFFPWLIIPLATGPLRRVRRKVREEWRYMLADPDPECEHLVLAGAIRRDLKGLPGSFRAQAKEISRELDRIDENWRDLYERSQRIEALARLELPLADQLDGVRSRLEESSDALVRASLEKQLASIHGRVEAGKSLAVWRDRLAAAQEECRESLLHLRSRLALLGAAGNIDQAAGVSDAGAALHELNTRLAATQDATEEVLRLSANT